MLQKQSWYRHRPRELYLRARSAREVSPQEQVVGPEVSHLLDRPLGSQACPCPGLHPALPLPLPDLKVRVVLQKDIQGTSSHPSFGTRLGNLRRWALLWDPCLRPLRVGLIRRVWKPTLQQTQQEPGALSPFHRLKSRPLLHLHHLTQM